MIQISDMRVQPGDSAFLIDDGESAILYDSGFGFTGQALAKKLRDRLGARKLDCIFLTHSHYDHAYGSAYVLQSYPDAKVYAGEYAARIFTKDGAKATMRDLDTKMARSCGVDTYVDLLDKLRVDVPLQDGQVVQVGKMSFLCLHLPGHTRCSFGFFEQNTGLMLACESLGSYNGEGDVVPAALVSCKMCLESVERVAMLSPKRLLSPHYGIIEGETAALFMRRAKESLLETVDMITAVLKNGGTKQDAAQKFKDRYYHGYIPTVYPVDAMNLNTSIMVDLIEREFI